MAVAVAVMMTAMLAAMALAVDHGMLRYVRTHLQATADASALSAAQELPVLDAIQDTAVSIAQQNTGRRGSVVVKNEVLRGNWTRETGFVNEASSARAS